ncbi:MAG TPA: hypothetical protein VER04_17895 [Polyangiaceae bacterium]|nr:hypothetical protein [Polyangiaceae bacterium]
MNASSLSSRVRYGSARGSATAFGALLLEQQLSSAVSTVHHFATLSYIVDNTPCSALVSVSVAESPRPFLAEGDRVKVGGGP